LSLEALALGAISAALGFAASRPLLAWLRVNGDFPWWTDFRLHP
jgi:hypothetical protein